MEIDKLSGVEAPSWLMAVEGVAIATYAAICGDEAQFLTRLNSLLREAPDQNLIAGLESVPHGLFAVQIDAKAGTSVALGLLGPACGFMLSRGGGGLHIASVALPDSREDVSASGASAALALIGAIALGIVEREHDRHKGRARIDTLG